MCRVSNFRIDLTLVSNCDLSQGDSKNFYPPAYGGFTWEIHVRYNNTDSTILVRFYGFMVEDCKIVV